MKQSNAWQRVTISLHLVLLLSFAFSWLSCLTTLQYANIGDNGDSSFITNSDNPSHPLNIFIRHSRLFTVHCLHYSSFTSVPKRNYIPKYKEMNTLGTYILRTYWTWVIIVAWQAKTQSQLICENTHSHKQLVFLIVKQ